MSRKYHCGDCIVYKKQKRSEHPGPRAHSVATAVQAGKFAYVVDKFWVVVEVADDGMIVAQTATGKRHRLNPSDPNLHHAKWWQRLWFHARYREIASQAPVA